jgi:TRAP-type C4-dicarboxylate transport system permease large subunit
VLPFLGAYIAAVALLVAMPSIALWLPSIVRN